MAASGQFPVSAVNQTTRRRAQHLLFATNNDARNAGRQEYRRLRAWEVGSLYVRVGRHDSPLPGEGHVGLGPRTSEDFYPPRILRTSMMPKPTLCSVRWAATATVAPCSLESRRCT